MGMHASVRVDVLDLLATAQLAVGHRCILTAVRGWKSGLAADAYIQLYDVAATSSVTVGTTKPAWVAHLDQTVGDITVGDGLPTDGIVFENGIVVAATTLSDNSVAPAAGVQVRLAIV